jgi:hypothetical protein
MGYLGGGIFHWDPTIAWRVRALQPSHLVVGEGAWFALPDIADVVGPDCKLILRDVIWATLTSSPADTANKLFFLARDAGILGRVIAHGLNEEYSLAEAAAAWELAFIKRCHELGLPTICLNLAYGNDPPDVLREVAEKSDFVGAHCYDGWLDAEQRFIDDFYTSRRYTGAGQSIPDNHWPEWWDAAIRAKHIPTEVSVERKPERGRVGWQAEDGPSEQIVRIRILENIRRWKEDGLPGACWFTLGHSDTSWESYYPTLAQLRAWAAVSALVTQPPVQWNTETHANISVNTTTPATLQPESVPKNATIEVTMPTLDDLQAQLLAAQKALGDGKTRLSYTEQGSDIDRAFALIGDAYNLAEALKATPPNS